MNDVFAHGVVSAWIMDAGSIFSLKSNVRGKASQDIDCKESWTGPG